MKKKIKNETGEHHPFNQNDYLGGNKKTEPKTNQNPVANNPYHLSNSPNQGKETSRIINYVTYDEDPTRTHYILLDRLTEEEFYSKSKEDEVKVRDHLSATKKFKRGDLNPCCD